MNKGVAAALIFFLAFPVANSMSIRDLISRYVFNSATATMNVTNYSDYMTDANNNGVNDTLVFEISTINSNGNFIFVVNLFDKNGVLTNETNRSMNSGSSKLNITFSAIYLSQSQFNYSIRVYNSTYSPKFRKDNIISQNYLNYEKGFEVLNISDSKNSNSLQINVTLNSSINFTSESILFLGYNNSFIFAKENKSIASSLQNLIFNFDNETIKRTHLIGNFNISSLKIGKKIIKTGYRTGFYDFRDFASSAYIFNFTDGGIDKNNGNRHELLEINASLMVFNYGNYNAVLALSDLFGNMVQIRNESFILEPSKNVLSFDFNGSVIFDRKLNGPYIIKNIDLYQEGKLTDRINDAFTTSNYDYNDFENANLPDLIVNISVSDDYHYGISNITINFTFRNSGKKQAFNIFTEIFDNLSFSRTNKTNFLNENSQIAYQFNFTNISDFEISAFADIQNFVEEGNESNNAERKVIRLNRRPNLASVQNISANETDDIIINLSASDSNNDALSYSVNFSGFSNKSNVFKWHTTTMDSGNYTFAAIASDGYLNDSKNFRIIIFDAPEKDSDDDGINDSIDNLIGNEGSVNSSTANITIFLGDSRNLSRVLNESTLMKFRDGNFTIAEFNFDFSRHKLNLTNLTIEKQTGNSKGSLLLKGLSLPEGATKTVYIDKSNASLNGICLKDAEISLISEISSDCGAGNEYKIECDGTLQNSYACSYNDSLNKYKVTGLKHSGIVQLDYTQPVSQQSSLSSGSSISSTAGGGGSDTACKSYWNCSDWTDCVNELRSRKCIDTDKCYFPSKKPAESEKCVTENKNIYDKKNIDLKFNNGTRQIIINNQISKPGVLTGFAAANLPKNSSFDFIDAVSALLVISMVFVSIKALSSRIFIK